MAGILHQLATRRRKLMRKDWLLSVTALLMLGLMASLPAYGQTPLETPGMVTPGETPGMSTPGMSTPGAPEVTPEAMTEDDDGMDWGWIGLLGLLGLLGLRG